jgi:hypothetical protein
LNLDRQTLFSLDIDFDIVRNSSILRHRLSLCVNRTHCVKQKRANSGERNSNNQNGNSSSSLPAIRANKFKFFLLYELLARRLSMWNILYSLFHVDNKRAIEIHPSVMFVFRECEKTGFFFGEEGNCCTAIT